MNTLQQDLIYSIDRLKKLEHLQNTDFFYTVFWRDNIQRWIEEEKLSSENLRKQIIAHMESKEENTERKQKLEQVLTIHDKERLNVNRYHYCLKQNAAEKDILSLADEISKNRHELSLLLHSLNCRTLDDLCLRPQI